MFWWLGLWKGRTVFLCRELKCGHEDILQSTPRQGQQMNVVTRLSTHIKTSLVVRYNEHKFSMFAISDMPHSFSSLSLIYYLITQSVLVLQYQWAHRLTDMEFITQRQNDTQLIWKTHINRQASETQTVTHTLVLVAKTTSKWHHGQ